MWLSNVVLFLPTKSLSAFLGSEDIATEHPSQAGGGQVPELWIVLDLSFQRPSVVGMSRTRRKDYNIQQAGASSEGRTSHVHSHQGRGMDPCAHMGLGSSLESKSSQSKTHKKKEVLSGYLVF